MKIVLGFLIVALCCGCTKTVQTKGMAIYPDALTKKQINYVHDSEIGLWGRIGESDSKFRQGMLHYYSRDKKALEYFTRCWITDTTDSKCFLGAGLFLGDVDSNYRDAVMMLEIGAKQRLHIHHMDVLRQNYQVLNEYKSNVATCQGVVTQIDSIAMIGSWTKRRRRLISACEQLKCDSIGYVCKKSVQ